LDEFRMFFSQLVHAKGAKTVELLVEYFRMNARAVEEETAVTVLPVCQLLLDDFNSLKPAATEAPESWGKAVLTQSQSDRASTLFDAIDADHDGAVTKHELAAVWGGDSDGLFDALDINNDCEITLEEWTAFHVGLLQAQGVNVLEFSLRYFERAVSVQAALTGWLKEAFKQFSPGAQEAWIGSTGSIREESPTPTPRGITIVSKPSEITVMLEAAKVGDMTHLDLIVASAPHRVHESNFSGYTPLMMAAHHGQEVAAKALLAAGADVNQKEKSGRTALWIAGIFGHANVADVLRAAGGVKK